MPLIVNWLKLVEYAQKANRGNFGKFKKKEK